MRALSPDGDLTDTHPFIQIQIDNFKGSMQPASLEFAEAFRGRRPRSYHSHQRPVTQSYSNSAWRWVHIHYFASIPGFCQDVSTVVLLQLTLVERGALESP